VDRPSRKPICQIGFYFQQVGLEAGSYYALEELARLVQQTDGPEGNSAGCPGFFSRTSRPDFYSEGNRPRLRQRSNICLRAPRTPSVRTQTRPGMPSGPGAVFLAPILLTAPASSSPVTPGISSFRIRDSSA